MFFEVIIEELPMNPLEPVNRTLILEIYNKKISSYSKN